jgi:hypothetical protein
MTSGQSKLKKKEGNNQNAPIIYEVVWAVGIIIHGRGSGRPGSTWLNATSPYFSPPGSFPAPVRIETAGSAPSKPRSKPKPKRKRVRAGSESEGEPSGGDSRTGDEDGDKGKDLPHKLLGDGG